MAYSNTLLTQGNFSGALSALGPVMVGEGNSVETVYQSHDNLPTIVEGLETKATNQGAYGFAGGKYVDLQHPFAFVWNGSDDFTSSNLFTSKGEGTFAVNPRSGLDGFYIDNKTISSHMEELSSYSKSIIENTDNVDSTVNNVVHKSGNESVSGSKTFTTNVSVDGTGSSLSVGNGNYRTVLSSGKIDVFNSNPTVSFHFGGAPGSTSEIYENDSGKLTVSSSLNVLKDASISGNVRVAQSGKIAGSLHVGGTSTFVGNSTISSGSSLFLNALSAISSSVRMTGNISITGNSSIGGSLFVNGNSSIKGSLNVDFISNASGVTFGSSVIASRGASISSSLVVAGNASISGTTTLGTLTANSASSLKGTLTVSGNSSFNGTSNTFNNITLANGKVSNFVNGSIFVATQPDNNGSSLAASTQYVDHAVANVVEKGLADSNIIFRGNDTFTATVKLSSTGTFDVDRGRMLVPTQASSVSSSLVASTQFVQNIASLKCSSITGGKSSLGNAVNMPVFLNGSSLVPCNAMVNVESDQTITGNKSFTKTIYSTDASPALSQKLTKVDIVAGTSDTSKYFDIAIQRDVNSKHLNRIYTEQISSSGVLQQNSVSLLSYKPGSSVTYATLRVGWGKDGNAFTTAPTPATTANGTTIATTAFVNNKLSSCGGITSYGTVSAVTTATNAIEFSRVGASAGHGGYIDFHWNGSTADNTSRIIEDANGRVSILPYNNSAASIRLGTTTIGSSVKPIYLNGGIPTACSSTVGSATKPVYMNGGTITAFSNTVGSNTQPVYMNGGTITSCNAMVDIGSTQTISGTKTFTGSTTLPAGVVIAAQNTSNEGGEIVLKEASSSQDRLMIDNYYSSIRIWSRNSSGTDNGAIVSIGPRANHIHAPEYSASLKNINVSSVLSANILTRGVKGTSWYSGRDAALVRTTGSGDGYYPITSAHGYSGSWETGTYTTSNNFYITYITDANYSAKNNQTTAQYIFPATKSGTVAVTSDIPTSIKGNISIKGPVAASASLNFANIACNGTATHAKVVVCNIGKTAYAASLGGSGASVPAFGNWVAWDSDAGAGNRKMYLANASLTMSVILW